MKNLWPEELVGRLATDIERSGAIDSQDAHSSLKSPSKSEQFSRFEWVPKVLFNRELKTHLKAFFAGVAAVMIAILPYPYLREIPFWESAGIASVLVAASIMRGSTRAPVSPTPDWWIHLSGFLPVAVGLPIFAAVLISFHVSDGQGWRELTATHLLAIGEALVALAGWCAAYYAFRRRSERT